jgi:hypothetical protein
MFPICVGMNRDGFKRRSSIRDVPHMRGDEPRKQEGLMMSYSILPFFDCYHLPEPLRRIALPFRALAHDMAGNLPECDEVAVGLRHLLEAKDCFVRAGLLERDRREPDQPGPRPVPDRDKDPKCAPLDLGPVNLWYP